MKISIFSKFEMLGGSEFRCVELANGIARFTPHNASLLSERGVPKELNKHIDKKVTVVPNCLSSLDNFYSSDVIIVVNTDVREFSTLDYWTGKSPRHNVVFDIDKLKNKKLFFLYNFLISPSRHLHQLSEAGLDIHILTTNKKFFDEITKQDRYEQVRTLPRHVLVSPIDQTKLDIAVRQPDTKPIGTKLTDTICFGMHSKRLDNKWNSEIEKLVVEINARCDKRIKWRFMGIRQELRSKIEKIKNVTCLSENQESVKEFLSKLDVFVFFPDWHREEPWARVIAEAMVSGCPVIALDRGGTSDQVLKEHNGFLCKRYRDYFSRVLYFIEHPEQIRVMSENSIRLSRSFYSEAVVKRLMGWVEC